MAKTFAVLVLPVPRGPEKMYACDVLLLTLEEPPAHAIFILATTNIENVPITILSRCQRFDFQKITIDNLVKGLKNVCEKENILIDEEALIEIAYLSEGGMRDALSLLDQLSKNKQQITLDFVEKQIKTISQNGINELINTIEENDVDKCLNLINEYRIRAIDYKTLVKKMIDLCSLRAKNIRKTAKIQRLKFENYKTLVINLAESLTKININVEPYTIIEMILLEQFEIEQKTTKIDLEKINTESITTEVTSQTKVCNAEASNNLVNIRINNTFVNAQKVYLEEAKTFIESCNSAISIDGKTKSILIDSKVVAASDINMILTCTSEHTANNANKDLKKIEDVIKSVTSKSYKLIFISEERWQKEKQEYILNLKSNKKYKYIEEDTADSSAEPIINDIFDMSKVEII